MEYFIHFLFFPYIIDILVCIWVNGLIVKLHTYIICVYIYITIHTYDISISLCFSYVSKHFVFWDSFKSFEDYFIACRKYKTSLKHGLKIWRYFGLIFHCLQYELLVHFYANSCHFPQTQNNFMSLFLPTNYSFHLHHLLMN